MVLRICLIWVQRTSSKRKRKSKNILKTLQDIKQEDIYCKKSLNINFEKTIICKQCEGMGQRTHHV